MFQRLSSFSRYYLLANASIPKLRDYELDYGEGPKWNFGLDWDRAFAEHLRARDTVLWRNWLVNDTRWAGISSLIQSTPQNSTPDKKVGKESLILNKAIERAKKRLTGDCLKLFQALGNGNPEDYFSNSISIGSATPNGAPFFDPNFTFATTSSYFDANGKRLASGETVFNQNSALFTGNVNGQPFPGTILKPTASTYGLSLDEIREIALLHEFFHISDVNGEFDDYNPADPQTNLRNSVAINKLLRLNCGFKVNRN
jgi:hypothetical protein